MKKAVKIEFQKNGDVTLFIADKKIKTTSTVSEMLRYLKKNNIDAEF